MAIKGKPHHLVQESGGLLVDAWMIGALFHGEYRSYYSNGFKHIHTFYEMHKLHGEYTYYRQDGSLQTICHYVLGERFGASYSFEEEDGRVHKKFWMNDEEHSAPFLPKKPERLSYKSGRTRLDTLEL